jgi:exodeoxyribonuclease V alpha subunit
VIGALDRVVGRGGVLDLAARWARPDAHLELESVHRFPDPVYADLSLRMRKGERTGEVFDTLVERGQIVIHASEVERTPHWSAATDSSSPTPANR